MDSHRRALGAFIRSQRELADLSLRQVAALADIVYRSYVATNPAKASEDPRV